MPIIGFINVINNRRLKCAAYSQHVKKLQNLFDFANLENFTSEFKHYKFQR